MINIMCVSQSPVNPTGILLRVRARYKFVHAVSIVQTDIPAEPHGQAIIIIIRHHPRGVFAT